MGAGGEPGGRVGGAAGRVLWRVHGPVLLLRTVAATVAATGAAGVVCAASLPVSMPVRLAVAGVAAIAVVVMVRHRWTSEAARLAVTVLSVVIALVVLMWGAAQWGRSLRDDPADPPAGPLWLSLVVSRAEGVVTYEGEDRCMVRFGDRMFIDPEKPDVHVILGAVPEQPFIAGSCS